MENYPRFLNLCLPVLLGKSWSHCSECVLPWVTAGSDWGTSFYWCGPLASELRTELLHFQCVLRRELLPSEWSPGAGKESLTSWHAHLEFILDNTDLGWEFWQYRSSREKLEPLPGIWGDRKLHFLGHAIWKRTPSMLSWEEGTDGEVGTTHPCYVHQDLFDTLGMWLFICVGHCPEITIRNININCYWCWGSNS